MRPGLFDPSLMSNSHQAMDFVINILEASTEYSIIGKDLNGNIVLWNEGARRLYGYQAEEVVGLANSSILHVPEDVEAGKHKEFLDAAMRAGKWEGTINRLRKNGERFTARVVITPRRDLDGHTIGYLLISKDVSDEMRLTEELKASQYYTRSLIESNIDALMTTDPLGIITDVNEQMAALTGFSRERLIGSRFKDYFTDPERAEQGIKLVLREGKVTNYELTAKARDGRLTVVSYNASVLKNAAGKLQGVFAAARDITAQKELEHQLRESQAYNRGLIEASVDGLITVDPGGLITDVNEQMCRISGFPREELIGTPFADYFVDADRATNGVQETFTKGVVTDYVLTLAVRDGRRRRVSVNASVFKEQSGAVRGIFASARDITEQFQLQSQLVEERGYNRGLIEASLDGLITVDPMLTITDVNETMCRMSGYWREDLVGAPFPKFFKEPKRAAEGVRLTLENGAATNYELTLVAKDGRESLVSFNAAIFKDQTGSVRGIFASARDITEQARLQQQLAEERAYNRGLIEASVDGPVNVDENMTITDVNDVAVFKDTGGNMRGIFASARDITAQKQLEDQLREQQTYLRGLIESSVDGLITVDPDGTITDVNQQMCLMAGYLRDELIGSPFKQYFTNPEHADVGVKRTFAQGIVANYHLVLKTRGGRKATVSFNASVFRGGDDKIQGIFASARDISEQSRLQGQLAEQQAYNRSLIESSADALFAIAPDGTITDVNEEATRLSGFSRKHLINSKFAKYFTEPDSAHTGVQKAFGEGRVLGYELVLMTRYGRRIAVSFNAGVFTDAGGKPLGILAAARDITAQKTLEQQLRDQQFYSRSLIESNIDALMTTDALGVITDVNQQMEELTGLTREQLIGTAFKTYFTDPDRAEAGIRLVLQEGKVTNYELTARCKDGLETVVSYNAATFYDRDGKLLGVFAAARDVTERKAFESTLQEKNVELENALLAKDRFLASMSHELRTPLNAIIGFAGTLLMKLPGPLTGDQEKQLRTIQGSARHLLSLINDLLDLAKIESGKVELLAEATRYGEVVKEIATTLQPLAESKNLDFQVKIDDGDGAILTDRRALSQIVINLTNNAIKFTEKGGVSLDCRLVDGGPRARLEIAVSDTGIGIRAEDRAKLFQAFQQVDAQTARRFEGTGLGLHLSQKLASLLGGQITFDSEFGKGSRFVLSLPTRTVEKSTCQPAS